MEAAKTQRIVQGNEIVGMVKNLHNNERKETNKRNKNKKNKKQW